MSYIEWVQNNQNDHWSEKQVRKRLRQMMRDATDNVVAHYKEMTDRFDFYKDRWHEARPEDGELLPPTFRTAATSYGVCRVRKATDSRGVWP